MRALLGLLLLGAALAGCAGQPAAPPADAPPADDPGGGFNIPGDNATAPPRPAPREVLLYLTADRGLAEQAPAAGTVAEGFGFFSPGFATGQQQPVPWAMAAPLREGWRITALALDLWFSGGEAPRVATSTPVGFEPVSVWFGSAPAWSPNNQFDAPDALPPGEVAHAGGPMMLPPGGFVLEAGMVPAMFLLLGYDQSDAAPLQVHVGGEEASRFTLTAEPFALPPGLVAAEETHEGTFTLNTFLVPHPDPAQQRQAFPLSIAPGTAKLEALLEGSAAAANQDLDLLLFDPSGQQVWASSTPLAGEGLRLYPPALAPGEHRLEVLNFQSVLGAFRLTVRTFAAPGDATLPVAA